MEYDDRRALGQASFAGLELGSFNIDSLRDWIWSALERLTGPLQLAILLRYFTDSGSYQQIAAVCGVPVGTIRSRLNQARAKLTDTLLESAAAAHDDTAALTARRQCEAENLISSAPRGEFREALAALTAPDLTLIGPQGQRAQGRDTLAHIMDSDLQAGVRQQPIRVTAAHHLTILECDLINPAWDPQHCPPAVLWVMTQPSERIEQIKLFHPTPPRPAPPRPSGRDHASPARSQTTGLPHRHAPVRRDLTRHPATGPQCADNLGRHDANGLSRQGHGVRGEYLFGDPAVVREMSPVMLHRRAGCRLTICSLHLRLGCQPGSVSGPCRRRLDAPGNRALRIKYRGMTGVPARWRLITCRGGGRAC
ncbi:MAG TPA: sigma-70 family RNA polymerase sigma factor [Streptosporangiaceae bacterium]